MRNPDVELILGIPNEERRGNKFQAGAPEEGLPDTLRYRDKLTPSLELKQPLSLSRRTSVGTLPLGYKRLNYLPTFR